MVNKQLMILQQIKKNKMHRFELTCIDLYWTMLLGCRIVIILFMGWGCIPPTAPPIFGPGIIIIPPLFIPSGPVGPFANFCGKILRLGLEVTGIPPGPPGRTMGCALPIFIEFVVTPFIVEALFMPPVATTTWGPPDIDPTTEVGAEEAMIPTPGPATGAASPSPGKSFRRSSGNSLLSAFK